MCYNVDEVINLTFSERLRQLRKEHGYSRQDLASLWNVSPKTIEVYERGLRKPDIIGLCEIADFYSVTTDYLLGRVDIPNIYVHSIDDDTTVISTEKDLSQQMQDQLKTIDEIKLPEIEFTGSIETLEQIVRRIVADELRKASK